MPLDLGEGSKDTDSSAGGGAAQAEGMLLAGRAEKPWCARGQGGTRVTSRAQNWPGGSPQPTPRGPRPPEPERGSS